MLLSAVRPFALDTSPILFGRLIHVWFRETGKYVVARWLDLGGFFVCRTFLQENVYIHVYTLKAVSCKSEWNIRVAPKTPLEG